jgi:hypothetical protein
MFRVLLFILAIISFASCEYEVQHGAPSTLEAGDQFGYFTAASGPILVITAPYANSSRGEAFVYVCPTGADSCQQTQVLTAPLAPVNHTFGNLVTVSDEGSLVVIGASTPDLTGALYVFNCTAEGQCDLASEIGHTDGMPGDFFGYYAFAYETLVLVGAPGRNNGTGEAYFYDCKDPRNCTLLSTLTSPTPNAGDGFGQCTGLEDWLAVVGGGYQNNNDGAAFVYNCSDPTDCQLISTLTPQGEVSGGYFGAFLYVADEVVYVTAPFNDNTTGYTYAWNCSSGQESGCMFASMLQPDDLMAGDEYGAFIVAYEEVVVVSAQYQNEKRGGVYVFDCSDATNCIQTAYLNASDASPGDTFGWLLAITDQMIVSTAPFKSNNTGEYYTYWDNQTSTTP